MQSHRLNWKIYMVLAVLLAVTVLLVYALPMLLGGTVTDENGESLGDTGILLAAVIGIIGLSYVFSAVSILYQLFARGGIAFEINPDGIENTFIYANIFAFMFFLRVRLIPWSAVIAIESENEGFTLRVSKEGVKAGFVAKALLRLLGYSFAKGFISPELSREEEEIIRSHITEKIQKN